MGQACGCCEEPVNFEEEVDLYHFDLHRAVGKGAFGKVRVVEHKLDSKLYALKYIDKKNCIKMRAVSNIIQERRILEEIDHPYVVNLRFAFQDDENAFFVLDLMLGGDLRFHKERAATLGEERVRFYVAQLSSAVAFLHSKRIMHRDIKPENVLLDSAGNAHLTDFNIAIHFEEHKPLTSVAGTIYSIAPEILARKGYTFTIDWWSLGVLAYELLFGRRPFRGKKTEDVMRAILNETLSFPPDARIYSSEDGIDLIKGLLEKRPSQRMCCKRLGLSELRRHPWYQGWDWEKLDKKQLTAPFIPDPKKLNFDIVHELDEYMSPSELLTHKKRKINRDLSKLSPEMLQFETEFTVYDYIKMQRRSYYPLSQPVMSVKPSHTPLASRPSTAMQIPEPAHLMDHARPSMSADVPLQTYTPPAETHPPRNSSLKPPSLRAPSLRSPSTSSLVPPPSIHEPPPVPPI